MKKKLVDLVYVLGKGSRWQDNEIRFSLRSVGKNLKNTGNIYIVGEIPDFVKNCIHVPCADIFGPAINADGNMAHKLLTVCKRADLSENFLFMNDDFIINRPIAASEIKWLHKGDMASQPPSYWTSQFYRHRLKRTFDELKARGMATLQYDYHAPMLMNKNSFISVMEKFDYSRDIGYTFRSLYGNSLNLPAIPIHNQKVTVFKFHTLEKINSKTFNINFVGYNDQGLNDSFKWWLIDSFPNKCKYETDRPQNKIFDVYFWIKKGKPYQEGAAIFKTYFKHKHLAEMFMDRETEYLKTKLNYKLMQLTREL
jgi:hypothetical protein